MLSSASWMTAPLRLDERGTYVGARECTDIGRFHCRAFDDEETKEDESSAEIMDSAELWFAMRGLFTSSG